MYNTHAFILLVVVSLGIAVIVYALVRGSLRDLLNGALAVPAGTTFYLRSFLIGLLLVALSAAVGAKFSLKPEARFIEYVWDFTPPLSKVLGQLALVWIAYLVLVTILAVPRLKDE